MGKVITISVPDWVDEKKFKEAFMRALLESSPEKMNIEEIRRLLDVKETSENVEVPEGIEEIRKKTRGG